MTNLMILRRTKEQVLLQKVRTSAERVEMYRSAAVFPDIQEADLLRTTIQISDAPPALQMPDGDSSQDRSVTDAENAIRLYQYLGEMTRTQASDSRLWAALSHTTFWEYTQKRWPVPKEAQHDQRGGNPVTFILQHWFVEGGGKAALARHAISRLWWAAHLTKAPWEKDRDLAIFEQADKWRFTRLMLRYQQIYVDVMERDFGSDLRLRSCFLAAIEKWLPKVGRKGDLSSESAKRINLVLKGRSLGALKVGDMFTVCDRIVENVARQLSPAVARGGTSLIQPDNSSQVP